MPVISDSSALILYAKIGHLDLLRQVFAEVLIPLAVQAEIAAAGLSRPDAIAILTAAWIRLHPVGDRMLLESLRNTLDPGEAEVITVAVELGAELPVLLDDLKGRRHARRQGLPLYGSAGVLVLAKEQHLIREVRPVLDQLRAAGLYLSDGPYRAALVSAGEG